MNRFLIAIMIFLLYTSAFSKNDSYVISQSYFFKVMPVYQLWNVSDNSYISEFSIPLFAYLPLGRNLGITVRSSQASIRGDVPAIEGFTDTQLGLNYHLKAANLVFNIGVNLPSGKKELTSNEFLTSSILSLNHFNFAVPNFGQGLNISPGLSWALALSDNFVLGLGATYQYKGNFKPIEGMIEDYFPGDEILLTGGFDIRLGPNSSFSSDVIYVTYSADKIGNGTVFKAGNRIVATARLQNYFGHHKLLLLGRFRSRSKNSYAVAGAILEEAQKTIPNQLEFLGNFTLRINNNFSLGFAANINSFENTSLFPGIDLVGFGIAPKLSFSRRISFPLLFKYNYGIYSNQDIISGYEGGVGLEIKL